MTARMMKSKKGNGAQIVGRAHAQRFLAHLDRQKVQEQIPEDGEAARAVGQRRAAAENGFPDARRAQPLQNPADSRCRRHRSTSHLQDLACADDLQLVHQQLSVRASAISRNEAAAAAQARRSTVPSDWNLLPWQGHSIKLSSGFHCVMQPRCVQTAETA